MLLLLGTTSAWADKYYTVGKRVTGSLEYGKKYMIFNTAYYGTQNRSGFLYNMGTTFGLKRFTSVDKYVCNEAFVFVLEDAGDDDSHTFYLKSAASGGYMDLDGRQSVTPTVLNIYTWDEATDGDVYTVETSGVTLTDNNAIKQACVKSLNASYTVVAENNVTSEGNAVYVIANQDNSWYFNGNSDSYATWTDGHPYAFYECKEMTAAETFDIQDLHIYSRSDFFSAQKIYGFVQDASQITANPSYEGEGAIANLIDGNFKSYNITNWGDNSQVHYYQIDLETSVESLRLYMATRSDGKHAPLVYEVLATNDPAGEWTQIDLGDNNTTSLNSRLAYISPIINLGANYRYIRIQAPNGRSSAEQCLALSELYVLPNRAEINNSMAFFDNTLPVAAPEGTYKAIIDQYNATASAAKLFSGVPVPGNKYRIYADAYSVEYDDEGNVTSANYVNRHVSINADGNALSASGDYFTAGENQEAFEWYCEESSDGKLLFRNVKYPTLYLSNAGVVNESNIDDAKFTINTNETQRHGVPLINRNSQYLTVYNDGVHWMGDVKRPQNQTVTTGTLDYQNTPDNTDDDMEAAGGLCTDFVFIPVELDNDEVRFSITSSELADRNSKLIVGGTVYDLPFSKVFYNGVPEITIESTVGEFYEFTGFYKGDTKIGNTINNEFFANSTLVSGDVVEARFEVKKLPSVSTQGNIILYQIKSRSGKSVAQNAGMSRAGLGYDDEDDEFTSMESGKNYYFASFATKSEPLNLFYHDDELTANSFFYFTNDEAVPGENFMVYINSAITTFRNHSPSEWTSGGSLHYIQPNAVGGGKYGFAITKTQLNSSNNPYAWNSQYTDAGNTVVEYGAEDENSAWEFVPVDNAVAEEKLTLYIKKTAADMIVSLTASLDKSGLDNDKINSTIKTIEAIAGQYSDGSFDTSGKINGAPVTALVGYAQELHMLHHEIEYAMQALPEVTDENAEDFQPKWYYIKNVNTGYYARYQGADNLMTLTKDINNKLPHLFFFAGEVSNEGTKDEYLTTHIHNFMALNLKDASQDSTIVSYNRELLSTDVHPTNDNSQTIIKLNEAEQLKKSEAWELELNFDLASGAFFNGWGSGLLASGGNATIDGGTYKNGFQVYLQNSGNVVIRGGDSEATDDYKFSHTIGKYSTLKVVLTYANHRLQVAVTNSEGVTQTIKDTPRGLANNGRDYIPCQYMADVTTLASAMAAASSFKLKAEVVLAMKWDTHTNNIVNGVEGDKWYILPSSNTAYPGLAIVTDGPDDKNMGWSNVNGENIEIFTGPGVDDYSTWQLEKVEEFKVHIQELLDLYDIKDCIIYNEELVTLYKEIHRIVESGETDEAIFNELFNLIRGYNGPTPAELRAPKPGTLYTIRPVADEMTSNALQVHVVEKKNNYSTTEVYNATAIDNENNVDSRAAWIFEGNTIDADGFYYPANGLNLRNIHTQTNLSVLGSNATMLADDIASISLSPLGFCTTSFKVGEKYMNFGIMTEYVMDAGFWGNAVTEYPAEVGEKFATVNGASTVHCKAFEVVVDVQGDVTVTFTHNEGQHKLNILGVTLTDINGKVVAGDYRHTTAGGNPTTQTYTLTNVLPATYTLNCYVCELNGGDNDKLQRAQGDITFSGISQFAGEARVTNDGSATTKWIIEEIKNPEESVYFGVSTYDYGYNTLKLGFPAYIPEGVEAFYARIHGDIKKDRYVSMVSYGEPTDEVRILPSNTAVVLRNVDGEAAAKDYKFYYSATNATPVADKYLHGALYYTVVDCSSYDTTDFDGDGNSDGDVNIYMLQASKGVGKLYWIYEERSADGTIAPGNANTDNGGYIACKANKSFVVLPKKIVASTTSFSMKHEVGETTEIEDIEASDVELIETIYDVQGRKLKDISAPGVYIVNGKKVLVK